MKYFIIAETLEQYGNFVKKNELDPGKVFYCSSRKEAERDVKRNRDQEIQAEIIDIL
jgi:hypothetical protein